MALLTTEQRKARFKFLGLGEYNTANIKKFQKKYLRSKDVDGIYGINTDRALRHVYNVKKCTKNFEPEEFKCECGGKYCTGYPSYMKQVELKNLQTIRTHFGKPMTVTCGLRCKKYNSILAGSIQNSKHLTGYACDFYMKGVTDTLANRKAAIKYIKKLPNHNYTYGNGINSNGVKVAASYMGNALHTDTNKPVKVTTWVDRANAWAKKIAADNSFHYVKWSSNTKTHECPICHNHAKGAYHGWNCIGFAYAVWHHGGGLKNNCNCHIIANDTGEKMYKASMADALAIAKKYIGLKDIKVIRNKNGIPKSKWKAGDICMQFSGSTYVHTFYYMGNGKIADSTGSNGKVANDKQIAVRDYKNYSAKIIIRYTGK